MKPYTIKMPVKPTEITFIDSKEGYIWFKELDLSIDFFIVDEVLKPKQFWITGSNLIELNQVPFLSEWIDDVLGTNRKEIFEQYNNQI